MKCIKNTSSVYNARNFVEMCLIFKQYFFKECMGIISLMVNFLFRSNTFLFVGHQSDSEKRNY